MYFDTEIIKIDHKKYCAYCGKKAINNTEYDDYHPIEHYYCDCEKAKIEIEMQKEINKIKEKYKGKLNKLTYSQEQELRYQHELFYLKLKYNRVNK